jgi:hypothetical protein
MTVTLITFEIDQTGFKESKQFLAVSASGADGN